MTEATIAPTRDQLGRDDWVRAAIEIMIDSSVEHVRVEGIARELNVSKGSFYWHFKNRDDLLDAVLETWTREATLSVSDRVRQRAGSPADRLMLFLRLPLNSRKASKASDLELAILGWARRSRMAEDAVAKVDQLRVEELVSIFNELGFDAEKSAANAHTAYAFLRYIAQRRDMAVNEKMKLTSIVHQNLLL
jgi:AcrR family transcriptional regulator